MIPPPIIRFFILFFGCVLPAYSCYKVVESSTLDASQLRRWCQYWMIISLLTSIERIADPLLFWVPLYWEAKLALVIYLSYSNLEGTEYVYTKLLRPHVASNESVIDKNVAEISHVAEELAVSSWRHSQAWLHQRFGQFLQYAHAHGLVEDRALHDYDVVGRDEAPSLARRRAPAGARRGTSQGRLEDL